MSSFAPLPGMDGFDLVALLDVDPPERWSPTDPGDTVQGTVRQVTTTITKGGNTVPQVDLETAAGRLVRLHCSPVVLRNQVEEAGPKAGDVLAVRYFGEVVSKSTGRTYRNFRVRTRPAGR